MPHNMKPPFGLPDQNDAYPTGIEFPPEGTRPAPAFPQRRPVLRKPLPLEDLALVIVVMGFVVWSMAFAYRMAI